MGSEAGAKVVVEMLQQVNRRKRRDGGLKAADVLRQQHVTYVFG